MLIVVFIVVFHQTVLVKTHCQSMFMCGVRFVWHAELPMKRVSDQLLCFYFILDDVYVDSRHQSSLICFGTKLCCVGVMRQLLLLYFFFSSVKLCFQFVEL